jgi:hypothetical protein
VPIVGRMKDLYIAIYGGGEEAIAAANTLSGTVGASLTQEEQYALSEAAKSFAFDEDDEECLRISQALSSLLERLT